MRGVGFCNNLTGRILLDDGPILTDQRFAQLVLEYEGFPDIYTDWHKKIATVFSKQYGPRLDPNRWQQDKPEI